MTGRTQNWKENRQRIESLISSAKGSLNPFSLEWDFVETFKRPIILMSKLTGIYGKGFRNSLDIRVKKIDWEFNELPKNFHNFKILHISDLHLDERPDLVDKICSLIEGQNFDIAVLTGDFYCTANSKEQDQLKEISERIKQITSCYSTTNGNFAILGNHDGLAIIEHLENIGLNLLINQKVDLEISGQKLRIIGVDDPHLFYNQEIKQTLMEGQEHFSIALVHSPEAFDYAEAGGCNFYLCGHTHGGQICLPGGRPVLTHLKRGKKFSSGSWSYKSMKGHTSKGVGTTDVPLRFFCPPELVIHTLKSI
ncbi:MAG: hypothetical protein HOE90_21315 [Bacteriovoracaceae bacterium]|nr:hypothetical protein [Bacteriovoracaceae bacterium]